MHNPLSLEVSKSINFSFKPRLLRPRAASNHMTADNMAAFRVITVTLLCLFTLVRAGQNEIQKSACSSDSSNSILKNDQLLNLHSEA